MKTFCEFTFDAAHSVPPHSRLHGHTFVARLTFGGEIHPEFGWPVNLYEVEAYIAEVKGDHHRPDSKGLDHANLDEWPDVGPASLENVAKYLWAAFKSRFGNLDEVELRRGFPGAMAGCTYRGRPGDDPARAVSSRTA